MRKVLQEGTWIRLSQGELYKITGKPLIFFGFSLLISKFPPLLPCVLSCLQ